jgi:putative lipoprotein
MMVKSLSKLLYASLFLALSFSLVACSSPKDSATKSSSSDKVSKSSKSSESSKSSSKESSTSSSQTSVSSSEEASKSSQTSSSGSSTKEAPTADSPVPSELVGAWKGRSPQAEEITMTVGADGSIWTQANFSSYGQKSDVKAVARAIKISQNLYRWELVSGEYSALTPGITGLGGIGKAEPGFTLENGKFTPVMFTGPADQPLDYSNYYAFEFSLTKN